MSGQLVRTFWRRLRASRRGLLRAPDQLVRGTYRGKREDGISDSCGFDLLRLLHWSYGVASWLRGRRSCRLLADDQALADFGENPLQQTLHVRATEHQLTVQ